ncbi:MAG: helix-turn-helix domain-containing protein [Aristaeellaceae bacterium]
MQYTVNNLGVDTYHRSNFCHELPEGFPYWVFVHAITPFCMNETGCVPHYVDAGTCIVYPPGYPRYLYCPEGQDGLCNNWIHFTCSDDQQLIEILNLYHIPINHFFTLRQFMPVISILQELIYEYNTDHPLREAMSSLLVGQMLIQISRNILPCHEKADSNTLMHLHSFELLRKQLYATPEKDWTVSAMAAQVYLGPNQFINLYRSFFDVTPRQDLIHARIAKAKTLLSSRPRSNEGAMTLRDVALVCGFKNEYYFSTTFKKVVGVPPGQYVRSR